MRNIHGTCLEAAEDVGRPGDHVVGANLAGFRRVADVQGTSLILTRLPDGSRTAQSRTP
jgi:hypothetical protein